MCKTIYVDADKSTKVKIFLHVLGPRIGGSDTVSRIYLLEMDANFLDNSSYHAKERSASSLPMIEPVFCFSCKERIYPAGMSCVLLGSKLYFMGGSLTYTPHLLSLSCYDMEFRSCKYENGLDEPINNYLDKQLENYPPEVYVFDCNTYELLPDDYCPPMHSGKYPSPLTFVANDQIFVLSLEKLHKDMITFESMKPGQEWKILEPPPRQFFLRASHPLGSAVIEDKLILTFPRGPSNIILSYNINSDKWASREVYHLPQLSLGSIFVQNTLYTAVREPFWLRKYNSPVFSFGPLMSTADADQNGANLEFVALNRSKKVSDFGEIIALCHKDTREWSTQVKKSGFASKVLLHLGGLLKGTQKNSRFFGFVELFNPYPGVTQSELRFVAFEALPNGSSNKNSANTDEEFRATTIHTSHFSTDFFGTGSLNAACAYLA